MRVGRQGSDQEIDRLGNRALQLAIGFGDIVIGVIENGLLEDEGCFLGEASSCTPGRLLARYRCDDADGDGNFCEPISNFGDIDSNSHHGTAVSSVILADYTQGQGDGFALGDPAWTAANGHSLNWKRRATGVAKEAKLVFFGQTHSDAIKKSLGFADAFDDAIDLGVDITNSSWGWDVGGGQRCKPRASQPFESELENAFDDGILNVVSAGNTNAQSQPSNVSCHSRQPNPTTQCNMTSPADVVKALTVTSLNGDLASCESDYGDCVVDWPCSATGGMSATVNGTTFGGAVTAIDLAAPSVIASATFATGDRGGLGTFAGTSAAAPVVAGSAALVKDWQLAAGNAWINNPGRLHTMMLAMTDRASGAYLGTSTSQRAAFAGSIYGLGRLKLRLFQSGELGVSPWAYHMRTWSFTPGSSDHVYFPFSPMPPGVAMVKCVLMQDEDMSAKDDISKIDLEMRIREAVNGSCSSNGALRFTWIDASLDTKKMTALEDSQVSFTGRCLEVTLDKEHVTSQGITTHAFCYYAGLDDDQDQIGAQVFASGFESGDLAAWN